DRSKRITAAKLPMTTDQAICRGLILMSFSPYNEEVEIRELCKGLSRTMRRYEKLHAVCSAAQTLHRDPLGSHVSRRGRGCDVCSAGPVARPNDRRRVRIPGQSATYRGESRKKRMHRPPGR